MTVPVDTAQIAARLTKARADRVAIEPFSAELEGFDLPAAHAVQRQWRGAAGPLAGWKLGLTSRAKQAQVGVRDPVRGFLAAQTALDLGAALPTGEDIQLIGVLLEHNGDVVATADRLGSVEIGCD